jgi:hypothetical protein
LDGLDSLIGRHADHVGDSHLLGLHRHRKKHGQHGNCKNQSFLHLPAPCSLLIA